MSRRRLARRGANAIEFALLTPVLLALITGMMDVSFLFALRYAAASTAQAAARIGACTPRTQDPNGAALTAAADKWKGFGLPQKAPTFVTFRTGTPEIMVVRVVVDTQPLVGLVPAKAKFTVTRVRRMEQQP